MNASRRVDAGSAAALLVALADLIEAGDADLLEVESGDIEMVRDALTALLAERVSA